MEQVPVIDGTTLRPLVGPGWAVLPLAAVATVRLPAWTETECRILASPAMGAQFAHYHFAVSTAGGARGDLASHLEGWAWVLDGEVRFDLNGFGHRLVRGSFVYLPPGSRYGVDVPTGRAEMLLHVRAFEALPDHTPDIVVENPVRLPGAPGARTLLPEEPAWDLDVRVITRAAGERGERIVHPFEHAVWFLDGEGHLEVEDHDVPVRGGTFAWIGAFEPHAFHATEQPLRWIQSRTAHRDVVPKPA